MQVLVVGAGLGGLSAACHLRGAGHDVLVLERADRPGGRNGSFARDGFRFDTGPTVLTMPQLIDDCFHAVGTTIDYEGGVATARKLGQLGLPRLSQSPEIIVEFVESDRDPGGLGEIGVPVVAPAIANALYAATGRRVRRIPLSALPL